MQSNRKHPHLWLTLSDGSTWRGVLSHPGFAEPSPSKTPVPFGSLPSSAPSLFADSASASPIPSLPVEGETVFTTASCGYPQSLSDPSYCGQILVFAFPPVGIYGVDLDALESRRPWVTAAVMGERERTESGALTDLEDWLASWGVPLVSGVDTRGLIRTLRSKGTLMGRLSLTPEPPECAVLPGNLLDRVSGGGVEVHGDGPTRVALLDYGAKEGILRSLVERGCRVVRFPAGASAEAVLSCAPEGIVLSNGPGDPAALDGPVETIRELVGRAPILGICLGNQLLARACGASTRKLPYGHRGANQPVRDCESGQGFLTSQNHGYTVDEASLEGTGLAVSYRHLGDGTVEGVRHRGMGAEGVQFHPEASPGPREAARVFDDFLARIREGRGLPEASRIRPDAASRTTVREAA